MLPHFIQSTIMTRLTVITLLFIFSVTKVLGQSSAKASVSVTIMEPVGAQKLQDLNFGNFTMYVKPGAIELTSSGYRNGKGGVHFFF
jgi:hypothetical protein